MHAPPARAIFGYTISKGIIDSPARQGIWEMMTSTAVVNVAGSLVGGCEEATIGSVVFVKGNTYSFEASKDGGRGVVS